MTQHMPPQSMTLFELIARTWTLDGAVGQVLFNAAGTSLATMLTDGRLVFVSLKDAEHPESRIRIEADTGRSSIRPRSKPLPPPVVSETPVAQPGQSFCRLGDQGFAFGHIGAGTLWRATARGQTLAVKGAELDGVSALAALPKTGQIAVASGCRIAVIAEDGGAEISAVDLPHAVTHMTVSDDGSLLGCWGEGRMTIVTIQGLAVQTSIACDGTVLGLAWSPCKRWLVAGCADKAVLLVDVPAGSCDRIVDFPEAVHSVEFSEKAGAMVASGAFRVVGWDLPDLPFGDHQGAPIETGKPGLTLVDRVAVHPKRDLCAVSYANGLVMICRIGHPDEMLVREGTGAAVTALVWSDDGEHLAIGGADGDLAIATFPKNMFK